MFSSKKGKGTFVSKVHPKSEGAFTSIETPYGKSKFMSKEVLDKAKRSANTTLKSANITGRNPTNGRFFK